MFRLGSSMGLMRNRRPAASAPAETFYLTDGSGNFLLASGGEHDGKRLIHTGDTTMADVLFTTYMASLADAGTDVQNKDAKILVLKADGSAVKTLQAGPALTDLLVAAASEGSQLLTSDGVAVTVTGNLIAGAHILAPEMPTSGPGVGTGALYRVDGEVKWDPND
jgi:hypothetical protein